MAAAIEIRFSALIREISNRDSIPSFLSVAANQTPAETLGERQMGIYQGLSEYKPDAKASASILDGQRHFHLQWKEQVVAAKSFNPQPLGEDWVEFSNLLQGQAQLNPRLAAAG